MKENKIQRLSAEAKDIASRPFGTNSVKRLNDIDNEIHILKEEVVKMGKLVLKNGKLVKEEDVKPAQVVANPASFTKPVDAPMYEVPPPVPQADPFAEAARKQQEAVAKRNAQVHAQAISADEMNRRKAEFEAQKQRVYEEGLRMQQLELQRQMEQEALEQAQAEYEKKLYDQYVQDQANALQQQEVEVPKATTIILTMLGGEEIPLPISDAEAQKAMQSIALNIENGKMFDYGGLIINPRNVLYFTFQ